jgi:hypothetical protein
MKILLVILGAVVATLGLYGSGFVTAMAFLSAEPTPVWKPSRDAGGVWTLKPVTVSEADQDFERLPARHAAEGSFVGTAAAASETGEPETGRVFEASVDETRTAAIDDGETVGADVETGARRAGGRAMSVAHVQWCLNRYRSYRVEDNSYTPYSGGSRACVSPYFNGTAEASPRGRAYAQAQPPLQRGSQLSSRHIQACFDRYRSYRPSDNSYQPYGGGPRRQCR